MASAAHPRYPTLGTARAMLAFLSVTNKKHKCLFSLEEQGPPVHCCIWPLSPSNKLSLQKTLINIWQTAWLDHYQKANYVSACSHMPPLPYFTTVYWTLCLKRLRCLEQLHKITGKESSSH